jgi:hypothetical protein
MKLTLLLPVFAAVALANPAAKPVPDPDDQLAVLLPDVLLPRQVGSSSTVSGRGNLNV